MLDDKLIVCSQFLVNLADYVESNIGEFSSERFVVRVGC